jgi:hypothetical protein
MPEPPRPNGKWADLYAAQVESLFKKGRALQAEIDRLKDQYRDSIGMDYCSSEFLDSIDRRIIQYQRELDDVRQALAAYGLDLDTPPDWILKAPGTTSEPKARDRRITVKENLVTVNGTTYHVSDEQAAFCKALADAGPGVWVAGPSMGVMVQRPDRIRKRLPEGIQGHIESKDGTGYRLKPE